MSTSNVCLCLWSVLSWLVVCVEFAGVSVIQVWQAAIRQMHLDGKPGILLWKLPTDGMETDG